MYCRESSGAPSLSWVRCCPWTWMPALCAFCHSCFVSCPRHHSFECLRSVVAESCDPLYHASRPPSLCCCQAEVQPCCLWADSSSPLCRRLCFSLVPWQGLQFSHLLTELIDRFKCLDRLYHRTVAWSVPSDLMMYDVGGWCTQASQPPQLSHPTMFRSTDIQSTAQD